MGIASPQAGSRAADGDFEQGGDGYRAELCTKWTIAPVAVKSAFDP